MTPSQQEQKDRARHEAEQHMHYSAVDRQRDADLVKYNHSDAITNAGDEMRLREIPDVNGAYPGKV